MLRASQELHRQLENYLLYTQLEVMRIDPVEVIVMAWGKTENPGMIVAEVAHKKATDKGREADLALETRDAVVRISRDGLKKIAEELIDNAFKFSQPGTEVDVMAAPAAGSYVLNVRDAGPGMPPEQIERLRTPIRFEQKLEVLQKGGLGLIIADHLLRAHGGRLRIESASEQGTHVFAELPLLE
jgi:signal transduction histidine kinase